MRHTPFHIVITGPESSGKSTLWNELKTHINAHFIEEVARVYLEENGLDYQRHDLQKIAFQQFQKQLQGVHSEKDFIISDTCLLTIAIWEEEKYGFVDNFTEEWMGLQQIDHYLLMKPDIPWVADPQRENKGDRDRLFDIYTKNIIESKIPYTIVEGVESQRLEKALKVLSSFI